MERPQPGRGEDERKSETVTEGHTITQDIGEGDEANLCEKIEKKCSCLGHYER